MNSVIKIFKLKNLIYIYGLCLVNFVIFKYFGSIQSILFRIERIKAQRNEGYWNLNLSPFRSITSSIDSFIQFGLNIQRSF